jgi:hypothetical protein
MTKPTHDRPTIPAPPSAHALNACRAHAAAVGLPSQIERKRRAAQKRLLARQAEIEARRDTVPAPALDKVAREGRGPSPPATPSEGAAPSDPTRTPPPARDR